MRTAKLERKASGTGFSLFAFEVCALAQFKTKQAEACSTDLKPH
jgi:hypothetical protein